MPQRTASIVRTIVTMSLGVVLVGMSFGAVAVTAGLPPWAAVLMSVCVFAGGAQFMAVGMLGAGNPYAAVFAGLLLNARHLPFGLAIGDMFRPGLPRQLLGAHMLSDETVAFSLSLPDGRTRQQAFWWLGWTLVVAWNGGTVLGVILVSAVGDPNRFGLDATNPASLLALALPALRDRETRNLALTGTLVTLATTSFLPAGIPVLLSLTGLLVLAPRLLRNRARRAGGVESAVASGVGSGPLPSAEPVEVPLEKFPLEK
jgi:4-azaleucine resistance transporter AzlC